MRGGWIKLWRKTLENPLFQKNPRAFLVFCWLLLHATNEEERIQVRFGGENIFLSPGQLTCGAYQINRETGVCRGTVEKILKRLKKGEVIELRSDRQCSLITVKNWKRYQKKEERKGEREGNERGTRGEREGTNKEGEEGKKEKKIPTVADDSASLKRAEMEQRLAAVGGWILSRLNERRADKLSDFTDDSRGRRMFLKHTLKLYEKLGQEAFEETWGRAARQIGFDQVSSIATIYRKLKAFSPSHAPS